MAQSKKVEDWRTGIGARVRTLRKARGMTQTELAAALHIGQPHVTRLERAGQSLTIGRLYQLAHVLEVPIGALLPESSPDAVAALKKVN